MGSAEALPSAAFTLALASLPDVGPARLLALADVHGPRRAWDDVLAGRAHTGPVGSLMTPDPGGLARRWARAASAIDVAALWTRHLAAGVGVADRSDDSYPAVLAEDPHGPALLIWQGDLQALNGPRVAVVGTRDCTNAGREFASALGRDLSEAGVCVVSGLALGIDGAAHAGALSTGRARPIAVVGSGLDVIYPRRHADLWDRVAADGVVLSEHPLGTEPVGWHFLARNRIIAMLADVVVVVESHERGGSLQTATQAAQRGRVVLAVPGSVQSAASRGTNALLADAGVCCGVEDVLAVVGMVAPQVVERDRRPRPQGTDAVVLAGLEAEPCSTETLMIRTGLPLAEVAMALDHLETAGWIVRRGAWAERVGSSSEQSSL